MNAGCVLAVDMKILLDNYLQASLIIRVKLMNLVLLFGVNTGDDSLTMKNAKALENEMMALWKKSGVRCGYITNNLIGFLCGDVGVQINILAQTSEVLETSEVFRA